MRVAVPIVREAQALYPDLRACSVVRGFHSPDNRVALDALLEVNALPRKGYLSQREKERQTEKHFGRARRRHPAVESAINRLAHHGLARVRTHGRDGFERTVAMSVLGANLHRLGRMLLDREKEAVATRTIPAAAVSSPRIGGNGSACPERCAKSGPSWRTEW